jgi:hypothetical protein
MRFYALAAAAVAGVASVVACAQQPVQRVYVPGPNDQSAYQPAPMPKPLPPEGYIPGMMPPPQPGQPYTGQIPGQPMPGQQAPNGIPTIRNEDAFVQAYVNHRSPRIMVFVNRTIQGDPLPKDGLEEVLRVDERQNATGAVSVNTNRTENSNSQSTNAGYYSSGASSSNSNSVNSNSFSSGGPAEYTRSTSVKRAADKSDWIGATSDDYQMIEAALVRYLDNSGRVRIQDADAARAKLTREQILRIENGDAAANRLLSTELQQDILVRVTAVPTRHATQGVGVRLLAKAVSTTDARNLGTAYVDMPPQLGKTNINLYTGYLASELMGEMSKKWVNPESDTIEVRVYKTASVDDALKLRKWLQATPNVRDVRTVSATGGAGTAYAAFAVNYQGAPEDMYADLKDGIGMSQGIKAVDLQNNTINLEVTGQLNLVTTTRRSETRTITETRTTEERRIEPINPAPPQPQQVAPQAPAQQ